MRASADRRRSPMSRPSSSLHSVQASRPRGNQAAQGALLSGTPRCRVRAQDGGSSVCLPRDPGPEKSRCQGAEIEEAGRDRLLRREAGIQTIATTAPDLPPVPCRHASFARDHEYERHGKLSLLAGSICSPARSTRSSGSATAAAVHRIPQASRCRLSGQHRDQANPRQSFRDTFRGKPEPGSTPVRQAASTLPSRPNTALSST